jgi:predicted peroxiredoxin
MHTGPENPTTAALGFLVAATAVKEKHKVDLYLAGDAVLLLGNDVLARLEGKGTGKLSAHFETICDAGGRFYLSGMSAKARGMSTAHLEGKPAEFAMPDLLVKLAAEADVVLTY